MFELDDVLDNCIVKKFSDLYFDIEKIVRSKNVCDNFSITSKERIWAYHKDDKPIFSKIDVVFTNEAIHTNNKIIKYLELYKFIVTTTDLDVSCLLFNQDGEVELSYKNIAHTFSEKQDYDLVEFVRAIQNLVLQQDLEGRAHYERLLDWFYSKATSDILSENYFRGAIIFLSKYDKRANIIRFREPFVEFDKEEILKILPKLDENTKNEFINYFEHYEKELTNPCYEIELKAVNRRLKNLSQYYGRIESKDYFQVRYLEMVLLAKAYYDARKIPFLPIDELILKYESKDYSNIDKNEYAKFSFVYRNIKMAKLLKQMQTNGKMDIKMSLSNSDGIGFNGFHYAIITDNKRVIELCLKHYKWIQSYDECYHTYGYNPFDYSLIAGLLGKFDLAERINETIGTLGVLLRTKKSLENYIAIREGIHNIAIICSNNISNNLDNAQKSIPKYDYLNQEKFREQRNKSNQYEKTINTDADLIDGLREDLAELEIQIERERSQFLEKLKSRVFLYENDATPYASAIKLFCKNVDKLYGALNVTKDKVKIVWGESFFYFNIKDYFEYDEYERTNTRYKKSESKCEQDTSSKSTTNNGSNRSNSTNNSSKQERKAKVTRPYGNSWFSPEAYKDYQKLRVEYKELAKKYHPDNKLGSEEIFKEINAERELIMEKIH